MFIKKKRSDSLSRIGDIFTEAGVIKTDLVNQSLAIAKNAKLPLGRVLVMSGHLSDREVESALLAQQGLREGRFTKEYVMRLVRLVHANDVSFDEAVARLSWEQVHSTNFTQLGKLFLGANIIEYEDLQVCQQEAHANSLPLGRYLVENKKISLELLENALTIMVLMRDNRLSNVQSIQILKRIAENPINLRQALQEIELEHVLDDDRIRLAELLLGAGVIEEYQALDALENSIENEQLIGQVFLHLSALNELVLEASLRVQEMVASGQLSVARACELICLVKEVDAPIEQLIAELQRINQVAHFIRKAELLDHQKIRAVAASVEDVENDFGGALLRSGLVNGTVFGYASYCLDLFETNKLFQHEAYELLKYCAHYSIDPEAAMVKLGLGKESDCRFGEDDLLGKTA